MGSCSGTPEAVRSILAWGAIDAPHRELSSEGSKMGGAGGASDIEAVMMANGRSTTVSARSEMAATEASKEWG